MHHAEFVAAHNMFNKFTHAVVLQFNADFKYNIAPGYVDFESDIGRDRKLLGSSSNVTSTEFQELQIRVCNERNFLKEIV